MQPRFRYAEMPSLAELIEQYRLVHEWSLEVRDISERLRNRSSRSDSDSDETLGETRAQIRRTKAEINEFYARQGLRPPLR